MSPHFAAMHVSIINKSRAVAGKPRDATVNFDPYVRNMINRDRTDVKLVELTGTDMVYAYPSVVRPQNLTKLPFEFSDDIQIPN